MQLFIKLTQAVAPNEPIWVNPAHISEMRVSDSNQRTMLHKGSDEDRPIEVRETPDEVNSLIESL